MGFMVSDGSDAFYFFFCISFCEIVTIQTVTFDQADEFVRVFGVGSIACFFKSFGPGFVVIFFNIEKKVVSRPSGQKQGMVPIGGAWVLINPKAFSFLVVIVIDPLTPPFFMTFDAKVIVGLGSQSAVSHSGFEYALC